MSKFYLAVPLLISSAALAKTDFRDIFALKTLKEEILASDPSPQWRGVLDQWERVEKLGVDPCGSLTEVTGLRFKRDSFDTLNDTQYEGIACRYQEWMPEEIPRRITNVHLPEYGLRGRLWKSLALLPYLVELDFDNNGIEGPIPAEFGCLSMLREFDVSYNKLTGPIPPELALATSLEALKITNNTGLSGCLPSGLPPFSQELCSSSRGTCSKYSLIHNDILSGTRNYGTGIRAYCDPKAYPTCRNNGAVLTPGYVVTCPPAVTVAPAPQNQTQAPRPAVSSTPPASPLPVAPRPSTSRPGGLGGLFGPSPLFNIGRQVVAFSGPQEQEAQGMVSAPAPEHEGETPVAEPEAAQFAPAAEPEPLCPQLPKRVVERARAEYVALDPQLDYGAEVWERTVFTAIQNFLSGTPSAAPVPPS